MKYVLDASVAICWVIPRPLTPKAVQLRDEYQRQIHELLAPAVFMDEVAGALTKAERQKDTKGHRRRPGGPALRQGHEQSPGSDRACAADRPGHRHLLTNPERLLDCLYVALAEREGCPLITADQKSINNLAPHFPFIVALATLP